jgi:hypothetical protein
MGVTLRGQAGSYAYLAARRPSAGASSVEPLSVDLGEMSATYSAAVAEAT